jgi:CheY-like chemotaxis protein
MNPQIKKVNILLIDDTPTSGLLLRDTLADPSYNLVLVYSGEDALNWFSQDHECALIIIDLRMPKMNGLETAELIRKNRKLRDTPIVFITSHRPSDLEITQAYSLGAVDFLVKPFLPEVLRAKTSILVDLYYKANQARGSEERFKRVLHLYVVKESVLGSRAMKNMNEIGIRFLSDYDVVKIIDVEQFPMLAFEKKIIITPTLIRLEPLPSMRVVGDLSDIESVAATLGFTQPLVTQK